MRLIAAALALLAALLTAQPALPACPEDAMLVGVGQFEHGHWTSYVCGPAVDDYQG